MNSPEVLDDDRLKEENNQLYLALNWWEKKRIAFNLVVGISGLIALLLSGVQLSQLSIIHIVLYGLFANLCYSCGFLLEAFDQYYLKSRLQLSRFRLVLFMLGLFSVAFVTFVGAILSPIFLLFMI